MTEDKNFKRLVRARMAETGESYTQARQALSAPPPPRGAGPALPREARILVTGHRGLVGSALVRRLHAGATPRSSRPPATSSTCGTRRP